MWLGYSGTHPRPCYRSAVFRMCFLHAFASESLLCSVLRRFLSGLWFSSSCIFLVSDPLYFSFDRTLISFRFLSIFSGFYLCQCMIFSFSRSVLVLFFPFLLRVFCPSLGIACSIINAKCFSIGCLLLYGMFFLVKSWACPSGLGCMLTVSLRIRICGATF